MSEWSVRIVEVPSFGKHPNADTLSITNVDGGYPVIFKTGEFETGQLAVYIPVDSVVPDTEEYAFLGGKRRIEAKRLRGIFSMGMLRPVPEELRGQVKVGDEVGERLGIVKYVSAMRFSTSGEEERGPSTFNFIKYTDHLPLRKYKNVLEQGEEVVLTEKIHGANARFCHDGERLWVGSHTQIKREDPNNMWWRVANDLDLATKLASHPFHIFFGEVYGQVQDLKYGMTGVGLRVFDVYDCRSGHYCDFERAMCLAANMQLETAPVIYKGPWDASRVPEWAEGQSILPNANCIREGFVVRPVIERWGHAGRVSLKYASETYLTRKNKKDISDE